jgi:putative transposase
MSRYRRSLAAGGTFFFTVNLADRKSRLLVDEIDLLRRAFELARTRYPFKTIAYCVLPEHLHAVWRLPIDDADFGLRWSVIKRAFSKDLPAAAGRSASKLAKREKGLWQRRFWEHQIRDETDLRRHVDYVHFNPVKHGHAKRVVDWPYSSFHAYVERAVLPGDWAGVDSDDGSEGFGEGE